MLPTKYASFLKRLVAHFIDVIIAGGIGFIVLIPMIVLTAGAGVIDSIVKLLTHSTLLPTPHTFMHPWFGNWDGPFAAFPIAMIVLWVLAYKVIYWMYFAVFESSPRQATPGKMMFGLFVTDLYGRRISFPRALGRTIGKILSGMFCWLGYLLALFSSRKQALHDMLASTLVLEPAYPAPYAYEAPPQATPPPGYQPPPQGAAGVAVPQPPSAGPADGLSDVTVPEPEKGVQSTGLDFEIEKPDEAAGEDKPGKEKE